MRDGQWHAAEAGCDSSDSDPHRHRSMLVFVSESISGGSLAGADLPGSLLREGRAMRDALVADLLTAGVEVVTTSDPRAMPLSTGAHTHVVEDAAHEPALFARLTGEADATYVIAPELDGVLVERVRLAEQASSQVLNCTSAASAICSDKLRLSGVLTEWGVPTPPTVVAGESANIEQIGFPCVLKRRDGAGSVGMQLVRNVEEWGRVLTGQGSTAEEIDRIVQPFVNGHACSVAAIVEPKTGTAAICPLARQWLSEDGHFRYLGGRIDPGPVPLAVEEIVRTVCRRLPGLRGYVGFDLILSEEGDAPPVLVEINPRLTTSYLGYRQLAGDRLARAIVEPGDLTDWQWPERVIEFAAGGDSPSSTLAENAPDV